jgi:hypothetical protein
MKQAYTIILLISPLVIGGIIAALNSEGVNTATEKAEAWARKTQGNISKKNGWFSRYIINPILWIIVKFCDWTDDFTHRGLKNGVRVAATLYLIAAWCFILYSLFMIAVILIISAVIIYVFYYIVFVLLSNSDGSVKSGYERGRNIFQNSNERQPDVTEMSGFRGQKIYSGTNWFNEELKGRVDDEGNIYSGTNWLNEEKIGRIDKDGAIYKGTNFFNEEKIGRIDHNGNINKGTNWFNEEKTGRIDKDGNIHKGTNWLNEEKTGRAGN